MIVPSDLGEPCPERRPLPWLPEKETLGFVGSRVSLSTHPLSSPWEESQEIWERTPPESGPGASQLWAERGGSGQAAQITGPGVLQRSPHPSVSRRRGAGWQRPRSRAGRAFCEHQRPAGQFQASILFIQLLLPVIHLVPMILLSGHNQRQARQGWCQRSLWWEN